MLWWPMKILGISAFYHDSAAALVIDGNIVAASQEERFTRKKHDSEFPIRAIESCLEIGQITAADLDYIVYYDKPLLTFERLLETYIAFAPSGIRSYLAAMPVWLKQKLHVRREVRKALPTSKAKILFTEHHEAHAAAAFFPSPFAESAVLTLDGVGEWATASYGVGQGNQLRVDGELHFPHSLGLLYSAFTTYCGFRVNSGEYKLMGLAPYGEPRFRDTILEHLVDLKEDGSFRMDMRYFNYCQGLTMTNAKFAKLLGRAPRPPESEIDDFYKDMAASVQAVTELIVLRMCRFLRQYTGMTRLCLGGGVALNCVANGKILREGIFDEIWIQPAAGDAGSALGAALFVWHQLLKKPRDLTDIQQASLLGPAFDCDIDAPKHHFRDESELLARVSKLIADGQVVGWFQGRMEFGPRALGSRSILGDARNPEMQRTMNLKIKFRESFRPFAPIVLRDHVSEWFELEGESPYMLLVAPVKRKEIPAVTHVDDSARVQTVDARHGRLHGLLRQFHADTGCPVMINTSFNIRGEPIVCTPEDAFRCFLHTEMDALVLGDYLFLKSEQTTEVNAPERAAYTARFPLD
jgi:carbamoyltransferase